MTATAEVKGGEIIARSLQQHGVATVFSLGERPTRICSRRWPPSASMS